jgi:hypothetical protein
MKDRTKQPANRIKVVHYIYATRKPHWSVDIWIGKNSYIGEPCLSLRGAKAMIARAVAATGLPVFWQTVDHRKR